MFGSWRQLTRVLLVFGCLAGLSTYLLTPLERPDQVMLATDVYRHATASLLDGGPLYFEHPPDRPGYGFLYPPVAALAFLPHVLVGSNLAAFLLQTVLNVGAALGTVAIVVRALRRRDVDLEALDVGLLGAFMIFSTYGAIQFLNGQINLWLAFFLALGFDAVDRDRSRIAGAWFALAALFKVFPAIVGLWLLRRRDWTAIVAAVGTGLGGLVVGALVFGPELTATYLGDVLLGRFEGSTYDGRPVPTDSVDGVHRQLAAIWPGGAGFHSVVGLVLVGGLLVGALSGIRTTTERDAAALATLVAILLYLPVQPLYFPLITFPLFMLLFAELPRLPRRLLLLGTVLTLIHVEQEAVEMTLSLAAIPASVADPIASVSALIFTFILPPTLGLWVLLITCVVIQYDVSLPPERRAAATTHPA